MQITIEVISVSSPTSVPTSNGRSYNVIEVAYRKDGKIEGKKLMSFSNPAVYKAAQNLTAGQIVSVTIEKNDKGYWNWTAIGEAGAVAPTGATPVASAPARSGGNYETAEERANRQVLIVRQSSLGHAVATLSVGAKSLKAADVITLAAQYTDFVLNGATDKRESLDDFPDDVPM